MASQLSMDERKRLSELREAGWSRGQMARVLGRAKSTISRELNRNRLGCRYCPDLAQQRTKERRRNRPLVRKMDRPELGDAVRQGLEQFHSPDEIAGRMKRLTTDRRRRISAPTIYAWIRRQPPDTWQPYLRRYGERRRSPGAGRIPQAVEISGRPADANERTTVGHWEGDTVHGALGKGSLVAVVDRKSRYLLMTMTEDRRAPRVRAKLQKLFRPLPPDQRRSVTFDHGKEFAEHQELTAELNLPVFFAQPYCPWQRGTCENTNRLIRQFFPKGTDFHNVSSRRIADVAQLLNNRPRKILNYQTPSEVFQSQLPVAIES